MKRKTQLLLCAALAAGLAGQVATAGVLFTNTIKNIQAANVRATLSAAGVSSGETYSQVNGAIRNQYVAGTGGATGKAWFQFDLSSSWAAYGEANLTNATLGLWSINGTGRRFRVAGIADGAGLESWNPSTLTWTNSPANDYFTMATMGYAFDWTKCYGNTNVWEVNVNTAPGQGIDVSTTGNTQGAVYYSTNSTSKITAFLKSDTDGLVTFALSDGPFNDNQTELIGTNGVYTGQPLAANGLPTKDSPTLTLVFDVRVALTGGGVTCSGGSGLDVSMAGTDPGFDYLLYTNGVYSKTVSGTGSAVSFGSFSTAGSYTAVASNTTTTATTAVPSNVTIAAPGVPSFLTQPTSTVAATNSVAIFSVVATNAGAGYQWFLNGTALSDNGHFYGTATAQLIIKPVLASDAATVANGYYCRIQNLCGSLAYSTTNALTIQQARNLVWDGSATNIWDIGTTANWWLNTAGGSPTTFISGDNITLDQNGVAGVVLNSTNLAPGVITFNSTGLMGIGGSGNISGPNTSLLVNGPTSTSQLVITNANDFAGGTTINDGWLVLRNNFSVGTNNITMAGSGLSFLQVIPAGQAGIGIPGINVTVDSTLRFDGSGAFAGVILGPITGTPGKKLTVTAPNATAGSNIREYGTFTCDIDLFLDIGGNNWAPYQTTTNTYNGVLSGNAVLYPRGGSTILNGHNTFNQTVISTGNVGVGTDSSLPSYSPLGLGTFTQDNQGTAGIFAVNGARVIENPFTWLYRDTANNIFRIYGTNQLTMSGAFDLSGGTNGITRMIQCDNSAPSILSGVISDAGQNCGLTKTGNGKLYLNNGANSYSGTTTVGAGVLAGAGNISGALVVNTNGAVGGGSAASIGTLSVAGSVTFNGGGAFIRVNKSASPANDTVAVSGSVANTGAGTVTVTNLGAALTTGDRFVLFPGKTVSGGNTLTITGAGMIWTNKLAIDGSIEVLGAQPTVNLNPTNITYSVSGNTLTLSWPADHTGWSLQAQTNTLNAGLGTNWITIGYANTNSVSFPIYSSNPSVFYRLIYATP